MVVNVFFIITTERFGILLILKRALEFIYHYC